MMSPVNAQMQYALDNCVQLWWCASSWNRFVTSGIISTISSCIIKSSLKMNHKGFILRNSVCTFKVISIGKVFTWNSTEIGELQAKNVRPYCLQKCRQIPSTCGCMRHWTLSRYLFRANFRLMSAALYFKRIYLLRSLAWFISKIFL